MSDWIDMIPNENDLAGRGFGFFSRRRIESGDPCRLPEGDGLSRGQSDEWDSGDSPVSVPVAQEGGPEAQRLDTCERKPTAVALRKIVYMANGDECDLYEAW